MFLHSFKLHLLSSVIFYLSGVLLIYISGTSAVGLSYVHGQISTDDARKEEKVCLGTNRRMSIPSNRSAHYLNLRDNYTNCTHVDGNLELTWLQEESLDLTFLQHIREVTGYVLISHVDVRRVVLPALQIIRGRTPFKLNVHDEEFALVVTLSKMHSLEMPALRDILAGSCGMFNNYNLCHMKTINWEEIITGSGSKFVNVYNFTEPERDCPPCHDSCEGGCWSEGAENCQKFSKINCSSECNQGRCFGPKSSECCHSFCIGGCTGPKPSDCLACRNFSDDGICKQKCPATQRYNPVTYSWEANPEAKYVYGSGCVKTCPKNFLRDNDTCVRVCPPKKKAVDGECVVCDGPCPCPKTCKGVDIVHAGNIESFRNCTVIEGSLTIVDHSFAGFQQVYPNFTFGPRYPRMHPDRLDVFSTLQEITGFFKVQASHPDFKNLSDFRSLEKIGGSQLTDYFSSLFIYKTSLNSFNLRSLKTINFGSATVLGNKQLCFADSINWTKIMKSQLHGALSEDNRPWEQCKGSGLVCSTQCSSLDGCWGLGPSECLFCAHFQLDETCIKSCDPNLGIYRSTPKLCKYCHHECDSCTGPGPGNCTACKNAKDGPYCVPSCPMGKFNDDGKCSPCYENCVDGCTGPENNIGPSGCSSCDKAIIKSDGEVERCLEKAETCPDGYYNDWVKLQEQGPLKELIGAAICRKCHSRCKKCNGYGFHEMVCHECAKYKNGDVCEDECPQNYYADEESRTCSRCANECQGCTEPSAHQCLSCRNVSTTLQFNCIASRSNRLSFQRLILLPFLIFLWFFK